MVDVDILYKYFPNLTKEQKSRFQKLYGVYKHWNDQINVISRKDFDQFYERHVLHSLGVAKIISFQEGTDVLDVGTGGGFPGIPLAILFPNVRFHLIDSIGKKIKVVNEVIRELELSNVTAEQIRAEEVKGKYDFVISRAVTQMSKFMPWVRGKFKKKGKNGYPNGIFYLKGGDLKDELSSVKEYTEINELSDYFEESFFETKKVVYIQIEG